MNKKLKSLLRSAVTRRLSGMAMRPRAPRPPARLEDAGLYLHVPFCENLCPFCPYNRWQYERAQFERFEGAVLAEIEQAAARTRVGRIPSFYVGGGTPTVDPEGLLRIMSRVRDRFGMPESTCIELHPAWADKGVLRKLRDWGVDMVSLGAQSFSDRHLKTIGRKHTAADAVRAIGEAVGAGFRTVNADIMFALPDQDVEEVRRDAETALASGANQLSTYPLFGFPYSDLGREAGLSRVKRPSGAMTRRMLGVIDETAKAGGLSRCSVWSWIKPGPEKFSSVSRHHYLGFGPSAASMTGRDFYINTFHVGPYADAVRAGNAAALCLPMDERLEMAYWLYWRLYEMRIREDEFSRRFGRDLGTWFGPLFLIPRAAGFMRRTDYGYEVTERGAYWIHRLQNEFSLDYIVKLWGPCRRDPWPGEIRL